MKSKSTIGQRLIKTREYVNLKQTDVAELAHIARSSISKLESDKAEKYLDLAMFYSRTYNISLDWLIDGIGGDEVILKENSSLKILGTEQYKEKGVPENAIPLYDIDINAGNVQRLIDDNNSIPLVGWIHLEEMSSTEGLLGVRAKGDSMATFINSGDVLLIRRIQDRSFIPLGLTYVLIGAEMSAVKYIHDELPGEKWLLTSHNVEHKPFPVKKEAIKHLFVVVKVLKDLTY
ncbi:XRE family transcriptional regulator [Pontibacter qinzhouensis]|uniref:XRE family transcriptional regulator n=1 Tax=Pontibacter qinzhouensis TaxID=2603253 RepID=UPI00164F6C7F|nr:LexA family transcriptional regulator [Pontibacter qinzhouensis]